MFKRFLIGIVLCFCTTSYAQQSTLVIDTQQDNIDTEPQEEITTLHQLETTNNTFRTLCAVFFTPTLFTKEQSIRFDRFVWSWEQKYQQATLFDKMDAEHKQHLLGFFVEYMQHLYLKLTPFLITAPLSTNEFQSLLLTCYERLEQWLDDAYATAQDDHLETLKSHFFARSALSNAALTAIARQTLPSALVGNVITRLGGLTQCGKIYQALATDWFGLSPRFAQSYIAFITMRKQESYNHNALFALKLNALIALGEEVVAIARTKDKQTETVFAAVLAHIRTIKQEIAYAQQLELFAGTPTKQTLFIKHTILCNSPSFQALGKQLPAHEAIVVDQYIKLVDYYLVTEKIAAAGLFTGELETTIEQLKNVQKTNPPSIPTIVQKLPKYLQYTLGYFVYSTNTWGDHIDAMVTILESIKTDINPSTQPANNEHKQSNIVLDFANQMLGKKQFGDVKSAALFVAAAASPFLLSKALKLVLPYLSDDLQQTLAPLVGEDKPNQEKQKKLLEFVSTNPELIKQLTKNNPEILDLVATELKKMAETSD